MPRHLLILLLLVPFLISCTRQIEIQARIVDLDRPSAPLRIHFSFNQIPDNLQALVNRVKIYREDTLAYELQITGKMRSSWTFPDLGEHWEVALPFDVDTLPTFSKEEALRFEFQGRARFAIYGSWQYLPEYNKPEHRWLFDSLGNQKIQARCTYEPWIGKDVVRIMGNADLSILPNSIQLQQKSGLVVPVEVKKLEQPIAHYILLLKENYPRDTELTLRFQTGLDQQYQQTIRVPDRSTMGLLGKRR
ncbi:MAG: hypothetical protein AAFU60_16345 [Bacteroidota bacterium]